MFTHKKFEFEFLKKYFVEIRGNPIQYNIWISNELLTITNCLNKKSCSLWIKDFDYGFWNNSVDIFLFIIIVNNNVMHHGCHAGDDFHH